MINSTQSPPSSTKKAPRRAVSFKLWLLLLLLVILALLSIFFSTRSNDEVVETITRDGVITQIQSLNRLQTIAFSVDTIITSQRQGNWYKLWQDEQKGLFVAHGRVIAGVDLNKLTAEQVQVSETDNGTQIDITIPKAEVFSVYLDDIEVYDLDTGLFGLVKADPDIFRQAQISGKQQVLKTACEGNMMTMALDNAQKQIQSLFSLTGATVTVHNQGVASCVISQS